jgi:hypothetical protein
MPIIRITRKQIKAANKAREAAMKKHPEFRLHEERLELLRQEAFKRKELIDAANKSHAAPRRGTASEFFDERTGEEDKPLGRETERDS